jgi:uncharacterized membrane protein YdjX (TVP38/TMEM64 family)
VTVTAAPKTRTALRLAPLIVILAVGIAGAIAFGDRLTFEALAANRERLVAFRDGNFALAAAAFVTAYAAIVAFSLPGATLATLTGGFLFGLFPGVLLNVTGATTGAALIFLAVRRGLGARLAARLDAAEGRVARLREGLRENELPVLFLLRLVPLVPFVVANILPALVGVSLGRFVLTTFLGILPAAAVYTWVGAGLSGVIARGEAPDPGILFEPQFLAPLLALAALAALPIVLRALRSRGA